MERGHPNHSAESLLGLKSLDRILPVPRPRVSQNGEVIVEWKTGSGFNGGYFSIWTAGSVREKEGSSSRGDRFLVSDIQTNEFPSQMIVRIPREGLTCILSLLATINRYAITTGGNVLHVARANRHSQPYYERFRQAGLYRYSDLDGNQVAGLVTVHWGEWNLYRCVYPNQELDALLEKFIVSGAVDRLIQKYPNLQTPDN